MISFFKKKSKNTNANSGATKLGDTKSSRREILIKNAMRIHKEKSKLLDNLDKHTRNRLRAFAEKRIFQIDKNE